MRSLGTISIPCPVCGIIFNVRNAILATRRKQSESEIFCSSSCSSKRLRKEVTAPSQEFIDLIKKIYDEHYTRLHGFAFKLTRDYNTAKDVVNDGVLKCLFNPPNYKNEEHLRLLLYRAIKNVFIGDRRKDKLDVVNPDIVIIEDNFVEENSNDLIENIVIDQLYKEIEKLPNMCQKVVSEIIKGKTTEEIMEKLQISQQNVLNKKSEAIKKLRSTILKKMIKE